MPNLPRIINGVRYEQDALGRWNLVDVFGRKTQVTNQAVLADLMFNPTPQGQSSQTIDTTLPSAETKSYGSVAERVVMEKLPDYAGSFNSYYNGVASSINTLGGRFNLKTVDNIPTLEEVTANKQKEAFDRRYSALTLGNQLTDNSINSLSRRKALNLLELGKYNGKPLTDLLKSSLQDLVDKKNASMDNVGNWMGTVGNVANTMIGYQGKSSQEQDMNAAFDSFSTAMMAANPLMGGIMKVGSAANRLIRLNVKNATTDGLTSTDRWLSSDFTPALGFINAGFGKNSKSFELDTETQENLGSSYAGTYNEIDWVNNHQGRYGLFSSNARRKYNRRNTAATQQQALLQDINENTLDALAASRDPRVASRAQSTLSGGYNSMAGNVAVGKEGLKFARRVLDPNNWYYVAEGTEKLEKGGQSKRKRKYPTYNAWMQYLGERGKDPEYDYQTFYNDEPAYFEWEDWEEREPGKAHMSDAYKKPGHITYGGYDGFGWMGDDETGWVFYPSPQQLKKYSYEDYVKYWNENEPESILMYPGHPGYRAVVSLSDPQKFKEGGSFNVIPEGALHARLHHMENADDITKKGIPVVTEDSGGNLTLHAEIERNEIIYRIEVTKKLEELRKKFYSDDYTLEEKDQFALEAGKLVAYETLHNTHDNTGLLKEV